MESIEVDNQKEVKLPRYLFSQKTFSKTFSLCSLFAQSSKNVNTIYSHTWKLYNNQMLLFITLPESKFHQRLRARDSIKNSLIYSVEHTKSHKIFPQHKILLTMKYLWSLKVGKLPKACLFAFSLLVGTTKRDRRSRNSESTRKNMNGLSLHWIISQFWQCKSLWKLRKLEYVKLFNGSFTRSTREKNIVEFLRRRRV